MKKIISIFLASIICLNLVPFSASAKTEEEQLRSDIFDLSSWIYIAVQQVGDFKPYTGSSYERAENLCSEADKIAYEETSTIEELQATYDKLKDVGSYMYIYHSYARSGYILALDENNDNGWYDENDWNDFTQKREALRLALNSNDEKSINDTYRDMFDSFNTMTTRYNKAGDLNKDGSVNVEDATLLQKHVAGIEKLNSAQILLSKCYDTTSYNLSESYYEITTVAHATEMQKIIAGFDEPVFNNSPNNLSLFIDYNEFNDGFNYLIICRMRDERYDYISEREKQLYAEGVLVSPYTKN